MHHVVCLFTPQFLLVLVVPTHRGMTQAELTWVAGFVPRWFTRIKMVTHPGTNRARCRVTMLIETNVLPLSLTATGHRQELCFYHHSYCDTQPWIQVAHPYYTAYVESSFYLMYTLFSIILVRTNIWRTFCSRLHCSCVPVQFLGCKPILQCLSRSSLLPCIVW